MPFASRVIDLIPYGRRMRVTLTQWSGPKQQANDPLEHLTSPDTMTFAQAIEDMERAYRYIDRSCGGIYMHMIILKT